MRPEQIIRIFSGKLMLEITKWPRRVLGCWFARKSPYWLMNKDGTYASDLPMFTRWGFYALGAEVMVGIPSETAKAIKAQWLSLRGCFI